MGSHPAGPGSGFPTGAFAAAGGEPSALSEPFLVGARGRSWVRSQLDSHQPPVAVRCIQRSVALRSRPCALVAELLSTLGVDYAHTTADLVAEVRTSVDPSRLARVATCVCMTLNVRVFVCARAPLACTAALHRQLRRELLAATASMSPGALAALLTRSFCYLPVEELRPVPIAALEALHNHKEGGGIPRRFLLTLGSRPDLLPSVPLQLRRQVWAVNSGAFEAELHRLLEGYVNSPSIVRVLRGQGPLACSKPPPKTRALVFCRTCPRPHHRVCDHELGQGPSWHPTNAYPHRARRAQRSGYPIASLTDETRHHHLCPTCSSPPSPRRYLYLLSPPLPSPPLPSPPPLSPSSPSPPLPST